MGDGIKINMNSKEETDRPRSSVFSEQKNSRPTLRNRYSSPIECLVMQDDGNFRKNLRVPSPDIGRRPGLSRRRYFGSLETLNTLNTKYESSGITSKFRIENGELCGLSDGSLGSSQGSVVHLENPEFQTRWYFKYFLGKAHQNYVGVDGKQNPFTLSICLTDADNYGAPQYRVILWRKTGSEKICVPYSANKPVSAKVILQQFGIEKCEKGPKEVLSPEFQQELLVLEEQEGSVNFKFGVLYAKAGQTSDDEMFSNETGSEDFNRFLDLLGDRITLRGWRGYRGGLDVKNDMTGSHSVFTVYEGHEIMFHVSSLLPYTPDNPQQVERKRHIGNDIATIVFQDTKDEFDKPSFTPMGVKSKFTHIFVLVTYNRSDDSYRVTTFTEKNVPIFGPPLPCPTVFHCHKEFRNFLLVKLINGEKAAYSSPIFSSRRQRTLDSLITRLWQDHMHEKIGARKSWGDHAISDQPRGNKRKEKERERLFLQLGQSLKLKTIVKGDAPTSLISTTANVKCEPWQPQSIYDDFPYKILCGDSWGDALVLGTEDGVYLVHGDGTRQLFDKSIVVKQLSIVEAYGLMLIRVEKGREFHNSRVCVFKLTDFEDEEQPTIAKYECKPHKLTKTKGCHLYAVSNTSGSHPLFMGVACGRKVLLFKWKHPVVWSTWSGTTCTRDLTDGFAVIKEVTVSDSPLLMTVFFTQDKEVFTCVGYKQHFDVIRQTGETNRLHSVDTLKKTTLVSAIDVYEDEEPEMLLSFNHQSLFKKLTGEQTSNFVFNWNSAPRSIVCAFPYLLAFTNTTIEIRLVVNGNLVHTLVLPQLHLITSKWDIYFTASPPKANVTSITNGHSPTPPSPKNEQRSIYKISVYTLMGQFLSPPPAMVIPEDEPVAPSLLLSSTDEENRGQEQIRRVSVDQSAQLTVSPKKHSLSRTRSSPLPLQMFDNQEKQLTKSNKEFEIS